MSCTSFASRTSYMYFTIEGSYIPELRKHYTTCDLAISNLNKDTAKGNTCNYLHVHQSSNLHPSTYLPVSILHIFRVTIPTLIMNAIISHHILTLDTAHISALQTRLQVAAGIDRACSLYIQESSSSTSSGAGLDPSHTNFTTFEILSTSQPCPHGEGITRRGTMALFQIAA